MSVTVAVSRYSGCLLVLTLVHHYIQPFYLNKFLFGTAFSHSMAARLDGAQSVADFNVWLCLRFSIVLNLPRTTFQVVSKYNFPAILLVFKQERK